MSKLPGMQSEFEKAGFKGKKELIFTKEPIGGIQFTIPIDRSNCRIRVAPGKKEEGLIVKHYVNLYIYMLFGRDKFEIIIHNLNISSIKSVTHGSIIFGRAILKTTTTYFNSIEFSSVSKLHITVQNIQTDNELVIEETEEDKAKSGSLHAILKHTKLKITKARS